MNIKEAVDQEASLGAWRSEIGNEKPSSIVQSDGIPASPYIVQDGNYEEAERQFPLKQYQSRKF